MTLNLTPPDNPMSAKSPEELKALAASKTEFAPPPRAEIQNRLHQGLKQSRGGENA
jgi:hypothetical protein